MNARPNYFCGVLYTLLGAVAAVGTVERFATHQAGGSLWLVGGSGVLLFAGILIVRETGYNGHCKADQLNRCYKMTNGAQMMRLSRKQMLAQFGGTPPAWRRRACRVA